MNKDIKYWLALNSLPNVGPVTVKRLWNHFGSARAVWEADEENILKIEGITKPVLKSFLENRKQINLEAELEAILKSKIKVLTLEDEDYPTGLKNVYDPPPVLYVKGEILKADEKALGIVGTRKASRYGLETARKLALELASLGITIVSGMALGIDTAAHKGALEAKGRTIAVFGCGVDVLFPPENKDLAREIELSGALVSEFPVGTKVEKGYFPRRNRIISGLSLGVIVVEGHYDSGAMITAKLALEYNREVFAVPGSIEISQSKGPHWLIKQGAKLIESAEDVLEELKCVLPKKEVKPLGRDYGDLSAEEQKIIEILSSEPKHIDDLTLVTGFPSAQVAGLLTLLELKKVVKQSPGKIFSLVN